MEPYLVKGDLIQTSKGLFYVMALNPTMIQSMTGGPIHQLKDNCMKLCSTLLEEEPKYSMPTKISNFIKECLSL